jgi:hypothetical protein
MKVGRAKFADLIAQVPRYLRIEKFTAGSHHSTICILAFVEDIARTRRVVGGQIGSAEARDVCAVGFVEVNEHAAWRSASAQPMLEIDSLAVCRVRVAQANTFSE